MKHKPLIMALMETGKDELNARKVASAIEDAIREHSTAHLATKVDLRDLEIRLIASIDQKLDRLRGSTQFWIGSSTTLIMMMIGFLGYVIKH